jgi:hypothetical protein
MEKRIIPGIIKIKTAMIEIPEKSRTRVKIKNAMTEKTNNLFTPVSSK